LGVKSTVKLAVSFVPNTVCLNVVPESLSRMLTSYSSIGLLPGTAAFQVATSVSVVPAGSVDAQWADTPVGADGAIEAGTVVTAIGLEAGLAPPIVVLTAVIW